MCCVSLNRKLSLVAQCLVPIDLITKHVIKSMGKTIVSSRSIMYRTLLSIRVGLNSPDAVLY